MLRSSAEIRHLVVVLANGGMSWRKIARELCISRNTVKRIIISVEEVRRRGHSILPKPPLCRSSKLDAYRDFVKDQLEQFPDITAVRLRENLQEQGFDGGYTIVRQYLRAIRPKPKKNPVTPFETGPAKQGQQDWSPYDIAFTRSGLVTVKCFSLVLGYSRRQYLRFCENEQFITLIREHQKSFEHFDGVPEEILYDGQKAVVLRWEAGRPIYNPRFLVFATHYGFKPHGLPPRRPDLKGKVERPFDYVEKNLLRGRTFRTPQHLNEVAAWWLEHRADVRSHGTLKERPIDRFVKEAPHLLPLPLSNYSVSRLRKPRSLQL